MRIGIIGPESTGKTTLARHLAGRCHGTWVPEYARTYVEQLDHPYTRQDVEAIARYQVKQLQAVYGTEDVFFDTELIITRVWFLHKQWDCPEWVDDAIEQYAMDHYLLLYPDIAWQDDPVRENGDIREELFHQYEEEILRTHVPYTIIRARERELLFHQEPESIRHLLDRLHLNG